MTDLQQQLTQRPRRRQTQHVTYTLPKLNRYVSDVTDVIQPFVCCSKLRQGDPHTFGFSGIRDAPPTASKSKPAVQRSEDALAQLLHRIGARKPSPSPRPPSLAASKLPKATAPVVPAINALKQDALATSTDIARNTFHRPTRSKRRPLRDKTNDQAGADAAT